MSLRTDVVPQALWDLSLLQPRYLVVCHALYLASYGTIQPQFASARRADHRFI